MYAARLLHAAHRRRKFACLLCRPDAPDVARQAHPGLRPLRTVAVPGTRLEIAELLVEHQIHAVVELDQMAIGIVVIDRDVMAGPVADRSPENLSAVAAQEVAGLVHVRGVAQLEGEMM